jgi:peptidoglycan hydrolase-like protein with peptidoglycan-binding domain
MTSTQGINNYRAAPSLQDASAGVANIGLGHRGPAVSSLQRMLLELGHKVKVDGYFGPETQRAVRAFQAANDARADGIVGPQTMARLQAAHTAAKSAPGPGSADNYEVPAAQQGPALPRTTPGAGVEVGRPGQSAPAPIRASELQRQNVPQPPAASEPSPNPSRPEVQTPLAVARADAALATDLLRRLVRAGGTADAGDVRAVQADLSSLPTVMLQRALAKGVTVVAVRNTVTDHVAAYRDQHPRGWPPGSTWSQVPGMYLPSTKEVVVATQASANGGREVRPFGSGHGAQSLTLHEFAHGLDLSGAISGFRSTSSDFERAYRADASGMVGRQEVYLLQAGRAGREEAFAEVFARFYGGDPSVHQDFPNMAAYFSRMDAQLRSQTR